ncbi:MAG: aspartate aminotransferase family protein, partial [Methylotenera sp.]|nr:aspartate aminotransferase family protein [Oligoflexia bacterium]
RPEMIVPITIHPAFNKAAQYFDVKAVHVAVGDDFRADLKAVEAAVTPNTILIVGSAPAYPHGVVDPITEMAALAMKHKLGCHVDACVGGFLLPFLKKLGRPIPAFDFSVPGVTSITADLHKYGFTAKGASVVIYRDKELRRFQFFTHTEWPGGLFASPSMTGTRPGGSIAAAWATLNAMGEDGYLEMAEKVMNTTETLQKGLRTLGLKILGKPEMSVFAFASDELDLFAVADFMESRRWHIDRQQNPTCLHLMVTPAHEQACQAFLKDLAEAITFVKANPTASQQGTAAMYGMLATIPDRSKIHEFLHGYMDERYQT